MNCGQVVPERAAHASVKRGASGACVSTGSLARVTG